jgi:hypothetical protein
MATVMRLAPKLPAYGGALALAIGRAEKEPHTSVVELSTDYPQAVHNGDTPAHEVDRMRQQAMLAQFRAMGVEVTGLEPVSDDELIKRGREGGVVDGG